MSEPHAPSSWQPVSAEECGDWFDSDGRLVKEITMRQRVFEGTSPSVSPCLSSLFVPSLLLPPPSSSSLLLPPPFYTPHSSLLPPSLLPFSSFLLSLLSLSLTTTLPLISLSFPPCLPVSFLLSQHSRCSVS